MKEIFKSELYKLKNSYYYFIFNILIFITIVCYCIYLKFYIHADITELLTNYIPSKFNLIISVFMVFNFIYEEEYRYSTLKNLVILRGSKIEIFLGKFITQILAAMLSYTMMITIVLICLIFFDKGSNTSSLQVKSVITNFFSLIPIILRALAFLDIVTMLFKNDYIVFLVYLVCTNFINILLSAITVFFKPIEFIKHYTINNAVNILSYGNISISESLSMNIINVIIFIIYIIIGTFIYKKLESN